MVWLPRNKKQAYRVNSKASNVAIRFDLGCDLDLEFWRSTIEFPISQPKMVRLPRNEKQTYWLNSRTQMWPMGLTLTITLTFEFWRSNVALTLDHTHDLDHGCSWSNFEIAVSQNGRVDWHCTKGRSFMTMTMTIWWQRSGVWIYQILTSVIGVPSTHLVQVLQMPQQHNSQENCVFSCDQAALRTPLSVCLSVRLSVTPFLLCSCHRIATKFSGVITNDTSDVHAKGQGHRWKVKVTEVMTQAVSRL